MSHQKFSAEQRHALFEAHLGKCVYTRELLDISDYHIDHVLPESLRSDPEEFQRIRRRLKLPEDFDLRGFENLVPCKGRSNLQKKALIFEDGPTHYFLGIAAAKKPIVIDCLQRIQSRKSSGRALILLQQGLERGDISQSAVAKILREYSGRPADLFELLTSMKFANDDEVKAIAKGNIETLLDRPIYLGSSEGNSGLKFVNDRDESRTVRTCRDYGEALRCGFYPLSNWEIKMSAWFTHQCGLLQALQKAMPPLKSFIDTPRVSIADVDLIPASAFTRIEDGEPTHENRSYQDKVDCGEFLIRSVGQNYLRVEEPDGMGQSLVEAARADFTGNGIEDILVFEYYYSVQGTMGAGGVLLFTRNAQDQKFEVKDVESC